MTSDRYTLRSGNIQLNPYRFESLESQIAVIKHIEWLRYEKKCRDYLRSNQHFHEFGMYRKCTCGMTSKNYLMEHTTNRVPCPNYRG